MLYFIKVRPRQRVAGARASLEAAIDALEEVEVLCVSPEAIRRLIVAVARVWRFFRRVLPCVVHRRPPLTFRARDILRHRHLLQDHPPVIGIRISVCH